MKKLVQNPRMLMVKKMLKNIRIYFKLNMEPCSKDQGFFCIILINRDSAYKFKISNNRYKYPSGVHTTEGQL